MDKTYLVCFVIFSLCFHNCHTNEDGSIALPDKPLSIGYQSMKGMPLPVAVQSRIISQRLPYNWILKGSADLRKRPNQNTTSSFSSSTLTSNSYETTTEEWSRLIIRNKTKYKPTSTNSYQWIIEDRQQCSSYEECQQRITKSHCVLQNGRRVCTCSSDYIKFEKMCLLKAQNGGRCNNSIQCMSRLSVCSMGYCKCPYGYKSMKEICIYVRPSRNQESFIWPLTISVIPVFFSLLFLAIWLVRGMQFRRRTLLAAHRSGLYEGRERPASENCFERTDKPPTYDEVVSTSTSTLTLSVQDLNQMPPPSYAVVQQAEQRINIAE